MTTTAMTHATPNDPDLDAFDKDRPAFTSLITRVMAEILESFEPTLRAVVREVAKEVLLEEIRRALPPSAPESGDAPAPDVAPRPEVTGP